MSYRNYFYYYKSGKIPEVSQLEDWLMPVFFIRDVARH